MDTCGEIIKEKYPEMLVIADVCLCEYTSHGHCGLVHGCHILNDETLPLLSNMAVTLAQAGAAPAPAGGNEGPGADRKNGQSQKEDRDDS